MRSLRKYIQRIFQKILGLDVVLCELKRVLVAQQAIIRQASYIKLLLSDAELERVKQTAFYKQCAQIISLLSPMDVVGGRYVRVGRDGDGGYVMLDDFVDRQIDAAYSFGIKGDVSWDESIAKRGIDVFMYDPTISKLPKKNRKFHFFKIGVTGYRKSLNFKTLGEIVADNGHTNSKNLILKVDIEGCEWDVFDESTTALISQFSQIVLEFHGLSQNVPEDEYGKKLEILAKINQSHQVVHVHANSANGIVYLGPLVLPDLLEVTYVRRSDVMGRLSVNTRSFPTQLDSSTLAYLPDIPLGKFSLL